MLLGRCSPSDCARRGVTKGRIIHNGAPYYVDGPIDSHFPSPSQPLDTAIYSAEADIGNYVIRDTTTLLVSVLFYGGQLILQCVCVAVLRRTTKDSASARPRALLLGANLLIMISSTVFTAFSAALPILDGLVLSNRRGYSARIDFEGPYSIATIVTMMLNGLIGDIIVFWRAWILWRHKRGMIYAPAVLLICTAVTIILTLATPIAKKTGAGAVYEESNNILHLVAFGFSVVTNVATNASIGYYTWLHRKAVREYLDTGHHRARNEKILVLILETGIIYVAIIIFGGIAVLVSSSFRDESFAWTVVNVIIFPAVMGLLSIYPSLFIVVIFFRKSTWDPDGNVQDTRYTSD